MVIAFVTPYKEGAANYTNPKMMLIVAWLLLLSRLVKKALPTTSIQQRRDTPTRLLERLLRICFRDGVYDLCITSMAQYRFPVARAGMCSIQVLNIEGAGPT